MTDRGTDERVRAWLLSRDPGPVPETLRASVASVPYEVRRPGRSGLRHAVVGLRSIRPARTFADMRDLAKVAIAATAVVVVAVFGVRLMPVITGVGGSSPSTSPASSGTLQPSSSPSPVVVVPRVGGSSTAIGRHSVTVDGVPLSFALPAAGWESHQYYLSKSTEGPQGAEAIVFWAGFPGGWTSPTTPPMDTPRPCIDLLGEPKGRSVGDLAAAVSSVAGTDVVSGPSDVTVGGRAAKHVTLFVTYSVLDNGLVCSPGLFYGWDWQGWGGAFWTDTIPGDTISVWIVDVDGKILFIEAETHWNASADVKQEIQEIVDSIRFE